MHILVTGATGGLGRNAVEYLLANNIRVKATGRNMAIGAQLQAQGVNFSALDLSTASTSELANFLNDIDTIWHCAALSSPWGKAADFIACNVTATENLLAAAAKANISRFIHVSTPAIYFDYTHRYDVREDFVAQYPANAYARTKLLAEKKVIEATREFTNMHTTILRPRAIFGPYDQVLIPRLQAILKAKNGRLPLPRGGQTLIDMTYVGNVVHALFLATTQNQAPSGSAFNISNNEPTQIANVLNKLFVQELEQTMHIVNVPYFMAAAAASVQENIAKITQKEPALTPYSVGVLAYDMTLNINAAKMQLNYQPIVSLDEGIKLTANWLKNHG